MSSYNKIDLNVAKLVRAAVSQVPIGQVTTYLDIAVALGDRIAARAVGSALNEEDLPKKVPCHRVVYSSGKLGKCRGHSIDKKMLQREGVLIRDGAVANLDSVRFVDFDIPPILRSLRREQSKLKRKIKLADDDDAPLMAAGLDVSYSGNDAFSACVVFDIGTGEMVREEVSRCKVVLPYIPSYLSFREIPPLAPLIRNDRTVYLVDGQGVLHPRGIGIASQIGAVFDVPTIGAAKSLLVGRVIDDSRECSPIIFKGKRMGCRVKKRGKKAMYVSAGHRVSLKSAVGLVDRFMAEGVLVPLRAAHILANRCRVDYAEIER